MPTRPKMIPYLSIETLKNHTLSGGTYLSVGDPPPPLIGENHTLSGDTYLSIPYLGEAPPASGFIPIVFLSIVSYEWRSKCGAQWSRLDQLSGPSINLTCGLICSRPRSEGFFSVECLLNFSYPKRLQLLTSFRQSSSEPVQRRT